MTPERWQEVERICEGALACAPAERSAFVVAACGGDDALRREVESLLANADSAERFIEEPAIAAAGALAGLSGLSVGQRLGPYHIVGKIGAGGMGEVYRAHDTQLGRDVAVKIVPPAFASDAERLARFEREARLLASLNHPHIASIYGIQAAVGDEGRPVRALVMELVEGPTLAERIAQKPIPLVEALPIARQIAEALAAAHEKGIVHRDLKPANIKLTADGAVKVLDFGLAKAVSAVTGDRSNSPTLIAGGTQAGVLLGTAAYMSPEQARGQEVDRRTDIWAFGCVLYEMLSGTCAFDGETAAESLGAVIHNNVDYDRLPGNLPQSILMVLRRCLQKDPKERLRDMGDVRLALDGAFMPEVPAKDRTERTRRRGLELVAAACLAAMGGAAAVWWLQDATPPDRSIRFEIPTPSFTQGLAMSPDGRHVAYIARDAAGTNWLHVRSLETGDTRQIAQTDRPAIWSPDSLVIAFATEGKLKRIDLAGGRALTLCDVGNFVGGTWTSGDVILFADASKGGILQVAATGGTPVALAIVDPKRDKSAPTSPWALPDGRHFLYRRGGITPDKTGIYVGRLDVPPERQDLTLLLRSGTQPAYVAATNSGPGYLLFIQGGVLNARAFDVESLELGDPLANVAEGVTTFGVSARGDVAYANFYRSGGGTLVWVDRTGNVQSAITTRPVQNPRLSPDGRSVAVLLEDEVWRYDLDGRPPQRLTFDGARSPLWTSNGTHVIYEARSGLASVLADGSSEMPEPASPRGHFHPHGWTSDGKIVALRWDVPKGLKDLVRFWPKSSGQIETVLATPADEGLSAALSPDGRWLAYVSNATGSDEIWLRAVSDSGASVRVSPSGGTDPVWARNGRELFYIAGTDLMAVPVNLRNPLQYERPVRLFDVAPYPRSEQPPSYDVSENGRFLMARTDSPFTNSITVILDWTARLRSTAPH